MLATQEAAAFRARAATMKIEVVETGIRIHELHIDNSDVAKYLGALTEDQRGRALVDAIKVGVFCLERARAGQDLDFVRREIESLLSRVERALQSLTEDQREAVVLKIYQGFKFEEMAEILGCPVSTVKSRLYTALELLKVTLTAVPMRGLE